MHAAPTIASFLLFEVSRTANSMCGAAVALLIVGVLAAKADVARANGLGKIAALSNLCFAIPLAVFGAEHVSGAKFIQAGVPAYMPWHLFWAYFVGVALIVASLSIATKVEVRWSGLLFGIMMFLFEAMLHIPRAVANPHDRIAWTIVFREMSFGGGGWILAGSALAAASASGKSKLVFVGRVLIGMAAIFFGIEHFLHPLGLPGVPLQKEMPAWIPARALIDYVTGGMLLMAGAGMLLNKKTRTAATYLGGLIVLEVLVIYGPVLVLSLLDPSTAVKVEGLNYFFDTLLFAGAILALARANPPGTLTA